MYRATRPDNSVRKNSEHKNASQDDGNEAADNCGKIGVTVEKWNQSLRQGGMILKTGKR